MPHELFPEMEALERRKGVRFFAASGEEVGNYGRKVIQFGPMEEEAATEQVFKWRAR